MLDNIGGLVVSDILHGLRILVTRPAAQAKPLIDKLCKLGADTIAFPTIEIQPLNDSSNFLNTIKQLKDTQIIIFISRNAVKYTIPLIQQEFPTLPPELKIAAVGPGTAEEIRALGLTVDITPENHYNTAGLLAIHELVESTNKHIMIARGEGGKEELADTLRKRGAMVSYLESYRRQPPKTDMSKALYPSPDLIITTSHDNLQNLYDMTPESLREALLDCQLLVISPGMIEQCETLGFSHPAILAANPSDGAIIKSLI